MSPKLPFLLSFLFLSAIVLRGQDRFSAVLPATERSTVQIIDLGEGPFYSFYVVAEAGWAELTLETSPDGERWSSPRSLRLDSHAGDRPVSEWVAVPAGKYYYRLRRQGGGALRLYWYNPGHTAAPADGTVAVVESANPACPCPLPAVQSRSAWCPGGCPPGGSSVTTDVTHLIVHHSAGTNDANDWAAIVRAIYDLHVTGNGWDDVGYNYLIDPDGVIYTGRGNDIRGAHFCGSNTGTMGVCMLGTFTNVAPTAAARASLAKLLAWKACDRGLDPLGSAYHAASELTLPHIAGHRQGCATACPGDAFFPLLPQVRQETAAEIAACSAVATAEPAAPAAWSVFPNPAGEWVRLGGTTPEQVAAALPLQLIDALGRPVRRWTTVGPEGTLSLAGLPAGIYRLHSPLLGKAITVVKH
jgi:hypothetical protein